MTSSQLVWAIDELVCLIYSHTLIYRAQVYYEEYKAHDGLILRAFSPQTLARGVLYLNRSISRITVKYIWKELDSLDPLHALFPLDCSRPDGTCKKCELSVLLDSLDHH